MMRLPCLRWPARGDSPGDYALCPFALIVQPILLSGSSEFAMFQDLRRRYHWVLTTHRYASQEKLIGELGQKVIRPAEFKVLDLRSST
jgi:hypothetical protein